MKRDNRVDRENKEEKRELLNFAFSNLYLKDEILTPVYSPAFQLIAENANNRKWRG